MLLLSVLFRDRQFYMDKRSIGTKTNRGKCQRKRHFKTMQTVVDPKQPKGKDTVVRHDPNVIIGGKRSIIF